MNKMESLFKIAELHAQKIRHAITKLEIHFPLSVERLDLLPEYDAMLLEILVHRFSKLQDFIGLKLVTEVLALQGEIIERMTMIDKINKMEELGLIDHAELWHTMREIRNHLAHEYPEQPELMVKYLNSVYRLAPLLLDLLSRLKQSVSA